MGYQSGINAAIGSIAGAAFGIKKSISAQKGQQATDSVKEQINSKQTGTKMTTRNTIQEVLREATMNRLNDEQIGTLAKGMNTKQRKEFKQKYIGEMNDGSN
jgi:uncharacterized protein YpuA (DUF1002 family)